MINHLWAKTTHNKLPGKSVISHMRDVRETAKLLLQRHCSLISRYSCNVGSLAALAGLHDVGKVSPGFQMKCAAWLKQTGLEKEAKNNRWDAIYESDHAKITQYALQNYMRSLVSGSDSAQCWAVLPAIHHGRMYLPGSNPRKSCGGEDWDKRRIETIKDFLGNINLPSLPIDDSWPLFWWTAGMVSVADWIGSNEDFFHAELETKPEESAEIAGKVFEAIGFNSLEIRPWLSFGDLFKDNEGQPLSPNDLQQKAFEHIQSPGLYVIEAPMGMGKTEAALWCSYQLMHKGYASGIYFALPTQATSNRIYKRINDFAARITASPLKARLIHAGSWLLKETDVPLLRPSVDDGCLNESARDSIEWFASKKRALLTPLGVGTVDQALMAVIAVKHFFVRQFALSGKVVILDEVHSYDLYTGTLIKTLCERLLPLGCTILVLSATLTKERKRQFIDNQSDGSADEDAYPCVVGAGGVVHVSPPKSKVINVIHKSIPEALKGTLEAAGKGASVLWICDTVNSTQEIFRIAQQQNVYNIEMGLLHARFPAFHREQLEDYWMEKLGKEDKNRSACILFSTQVVEQSVDLDADLMISELAPTDMLLQRLGRLWRRDRSRRPLSEPELWLIAERGTTEEFKKASALKIKKMLGSKASVYAPYVLLRSLEIWNDLSSLILPENIRELLERTYRDRTKEPTGWKDWYKDMRGKADALRQFALFETNVWQKGLEDDEGRAKTRINDIPMTQLILAKSKSGKRIVLLNDDQVLLNDDNKFQLESARSIHKNIVRVPAYYFDGQTDNKFMSAQIRGSWQFGLVQEDGHVESRNLKPGYKLQYASELGIEIILNQQNQEVNDEPCD